MSSASNGQSTIVRTSRGLSIAGTRVTLYTILDYLHAGWAAPRVQEWLQLTDEQMADVMNYLEEHRDEVEAEYQLVVQQADENRQYWEQYNRSRASSPSTKSNDPEHEALQRRLQTWRERIPQNDPYPR